MLRQTWPPYTEEEMIVEKLTSLHELICHFGKQIKKKIIIIFFSIVVFGNVSTISVSNTEVYFSEKVLS